MKKFMSLVVCAAVFGPIAAFAAIAPVPVPVSTSMMATHHSNDLSYQVSQLNGQVLTLNNEIFVLQQQKSGGTGDVAELSGIIPTGG